MPSTNTTEVVQEANSGQTSKNIKAWHTNLKPVREQRVHTKTVRTDDWSMELLEIGRKQDRQAFMRFFQHFAPLIKGYFLGSNGPNMSSNMIDELIQEVMLKVWTKASQFDPEKAAASTWLFTMARNTRIDMLRRQSRHKTEVLETEDVWATDEEESPVALLQQQRDTGLIREAIKELPQEQARVVQMIYLEGKTHSVASEELQLPLGTVKSRLRLALAKMKLKITQSASKADLLT